MVRNPSLRLIACALLTKMKGKDPTMRVMMKLMSKGVNAESIPSMRDTTIDRNINKALTSRALPTFKDIAFTFILLLILFAFFSQRLYASLKFHILLDKFAQTCIDVRKLIVTVKVIVEPAT